MDIREFARLGQAAAAEKRAALRDMRVFEIAERILIRNPTITQRELIGAIQRGGNYSRATIYRAFSRIKMKCSFAGK